RDSLVVPASADRPEGETFLTVGGQSGPHRYSRFGQTSGTSSRASLTSGNARRHQPGAGALGRGSGRVEACQRGNGDEGWRVTSSGFAASPFSAVDDFLRTLVCRGGVQGDLRQWSYAASESYAEVENKQDGRVISARRIRTVTRLLTHQVANNRWCCNIGRAHKSNHIFLVTDLSRGEVRQHCHDQDCRRIGYRSQPVRLPPAVAPSKDDLETYELELGLAAAMEESPKDWVHLA
ncbi:unnamed protein product, partial [Sphacelaria rigidula]